MLQQEQTTDFDLFQVEKVRLMLGLGDSEGLLQCRWLYVSMILHSFGCNYITTWAAKSTVFTPVMIKNQIWLVPPRWYTSGLCSYLVHPVQLAHSVSELKLEYLNTQTTLRGYKLANPQVLVLWPTCIWW